MIAILRARNEPSYIVYQENGRYTEIIRFETQSKKRAIAVLEIGENKNAIAVYPQWRFSFLRNCLSFILRIIKGGTP